MILAGRRRFRLGYNSVIAEGVHGGEAPLVRIGFPILKPCFPSRPPSLLGIGGKKDRKYWWKLQFYLKILLKSLDPGPVYKKSTLQNYGSTGLTIAVGKMLASIVVDSI